MVEKMPKYPLHAILTNTAIKKHTPLFIRVILRDF